MNARNFGYSLQNIPTPSKSWYVKSMMEKVESFLKRVRWKAHFFDNPREDTETENYGFKSNTTPPQNEHLNPFENDLYQMVRDIEFRKTDDPFQSTLNDDVSDIMSSNKLLVFADKTTNLYDMTKEDYIKLLNENVTKTYQKSVPSAKTEIDSEAKTIATSLNLQGKMECYAEQTAFITLKDHKDNFHTKVPCRLINPAKSEVGILSKSHLSKIIEDVVKRTKFNQWKNTSSTIEWFKEITDKSTCRFIKFDIAEFYPSISEKLLERAIEYASSMTTITRETVAIIMQARKSLLFDNNKIPWQKKGTNPMFDVTMGSFDGAEVCELVGLLLLSKLTSVVEKKNIGLYRDDGLCVIGNANGPKMDKIRKQITSIFKQQGLSITIDTNLLATDFLDVTFDLATGKYFPYRKPNDRPLYINKSSNHPPSIVKQLPVMINKRLNDLSCDKDEFNKASPVYESALKDSGYSTSLSFVQSEPPPRNRNRKRQVIWFNPPFNANVKSNVGRRFLQIVRKHFNRNHKFYKIFNINTLKLSYSCAPSMANIIKQHNAKLLSNMNRTKERLCNCRNKQTCPLNGECLTSCIVYKAEVKTTDNAHVYYGASEGEFKTRFNNHTKSFRLKKYANETELSKLVWKMKENGTDYTITWSVAAKAFPYKCGTRRCDLCLTEKTCIIRANIKGLLNKRTELISKCRHRNKYSLANVKC